MTQHKIDLDLQISRMRDEIMQNQTENTDFLDKYISIIKSFRREASVVLGAQDFDIVGAIISNRKQLDLLVRKLSIPEELLLGVFIAGTDKFRATQFSTSGLVVITNQGLLVKKGSNQFRMGMEDVHSSFEVGKVGKDVFHYGSGKDLEFGRREFRSYLPTSAKVTPGGFYFSESSGYWPKYPELPPLYTSLSLQGMALRRKPSSRIAGSRKRSDSHPPLPRLIRTWSDAELVAMEWMKYWGFNGVALTSRGADGGIDVTSSEAVAQVKAETVPTGRPKIQQLHGVAAGQRKQAVFFALAGYTEEAKAYANEHSISLFAFDLQGEPAPINSLAKKLFNGIS